MVSLRVAQGAHALEVSSETLRRDAVKAGVDVEMKDAGSVKTRVFHPEDLFKIARQINGAGKRDSVVDACGYMALSWDMSEEKERLCVAKHG